MKDQEILEILLEWNFWEKEPFTGFNRNKYIDFLEPFLETSQAIAITGVRRSGKSTVMLQLTKKIIPGITPQNTLIVNFEDYRFRDFSLDLLKQIYDLFKRKISKEGKKVIFLDEIHKIKGWEKFVRTLLDTKEAQIVVSGSNSELISKEYATLLTGRHIKVKIMPLCFKEILTFKGLDPKKETEVLSKKPEIREYAESYIKNGGFPEIITSPPETHSKILRDYLESIITKDVAERHKVREKEKLKSLARFYLTNISNPITFNKTAHNLDIPLGTVERFSRYLEEAFLVNFVKRFSFKVKEQENAPRKVYSIDTGLSNAIGFKFSRDIGNFMENTVFLEIKKRDQEGKKEIYYWQDQNHEVDFVIKEEESVTDLIQVCYDINKNTRKRETKSLIKASEKLKPKNLTVITQDYESKEEIKGKKIIFIPIWKWLIK